LISNRIFSFSLQNKHDYGKISSVTFGGYDLKKHAPNSTLSWNDLVSTDYWTVRLSQVKLGNESIPLSTTRAILDTGTSYTVVPTADFNAMIAHWKKTMQCSNDLTQGLY
jgi:hypothetical protein